MNEKIPYVTAEIDILVFSMEDTIHTSDMDEVDDNGWIPNDTQVPFWK